MSSMLHGADEHERDEGFLSDRDEDMSDGGAALTMTLSHAEQLNAELDELDAEVMGSDNLAGLHMGYHYQQSMMGDSQFTYYDATQETDFYEEDSMEDVLGTGPVAPPNLPVALSAVSQQLQHIQDGQEHADVGAEGVHHANHLSTLPFLLHPLFPQNAASAGSFVQSAFVSSADITAPQLPTITSQPEVAHPWGSEGWAQSIAVLTQGHLNIAAHQTHFNVATWDDDQLMDADDDDSVEHEMNSSFVEFLYTWAHAPTRERETGGEKQPRGPSMAAIDEQRELKHGSPMTRHQLHGEHCDIQRVNWTELGVSRLEARQMRRKTYKNYSNVPLPAQWHPRLNGCRLEDDENDFRFRRMDFDQPAQISHFQLRNLLSCSSKDHIYYASRSHVRHYTPRDSEAYPIAMDLSNPAVQPAYVFPGGVLVSTLTVAHDVLVAGGFSGEYGLVNLRAPKDTKHTEGIVTQSLNGITNHVQVYKPHNSNSVLAAFASNDMSIRVLDVNTNKFIAEHAYPKAINCTALSPDKRLRVMVGDTRNVLICNSETGEVLQELEGHRDFGFSCDWADDGWTVATGNQDMQIKIWDARKWTTSSGLACPIATVAAEMAGARKLKFSPLGSGKRVLVAAEPGDFINVIDARTFSSKQTLSFFGEIGGFDFTDDGQNLIVANCDPVRGGIMEFERCNFTAGATRDFDNDIEGYPNGQQRARRERDYDWAMDDKMARHPKFQGTDTHSSRRAAMLGTHMGIF